MEQLSADAPIVHWRRDLEWRRSLRLYESSVFPSQTGVTHWGETAQPETPYFIILTLIQDDTTGDGMLLL